MQKKNNEHYNQYSTISLNTTITETLFVLTTLNSSSETSLLRTDSSVTKFTNIHKHVNNNHCDFFMTFRITIHNVMCNKTNVKILQSKVNHIAAFLQIKSALTQIVSTKLRL